jgi:hypothetical protein
MQSTGALPQLTDVTRHAEVKFLQEQKDRLVIFGKEKRDSQFRARCNRANQVE